jgi:pyruvate/2-oxoglutarate dehydrogenase complex dihydrolipoamide dehydrogenase (E3) component
VPDDVSPHHPAGFGGGDTRQPVRDFDHVIVGSGQAASVLVRGLPANETIAVIEGAQVGGSCVNVGCTPTKTLVASARVAHLASRAPDFGVRVGDVTVDYAAVWERMDAVRRASREGLERLLEQRANVTLIRGWARFDGPRRLAVGDEVVRGGRVYLNVGASARVPDVEGLEAVHWLDNVGLLELRELPRHLLVMGGSYVGLEFAHVFARLGSRVTVLEASGQVMPREDRDVAEALREALAGEGIDVRLRAKARRARRGDGGGIEVLVDGDDGERWLSGSHLLVATGRAPNTGRLDLGAAGVERDERGYVRVSDTLETTCPGVYALGDVNGQGAFTHTSVNDAEIVLDALRGGPRRLPDRVPVYALFTDPPLGRAGLSEREALRRGHRVLRATLPMSSVNRAVEAGETQGLIKLLVDAADDRLLGAAVLGVGGDEIVNMLAAAMAAGVTASTFRRSVLVHPTVGEIVPWVLDALEPVEPE